jgi:hypothetical protein
MAGSAGVRKAPAEYLPFSHTAPLAPTAPDRRLDA